MAPDADTDFIKSYFQESSRVQLSLAEQSDVVKNIADSLCEIVSNGGRIYTCGNGGSTCDAMHFVEELVARFHRERPGIPAQHLCDASTITCWANDYSFEEIFERQVKTLVTKSDALVAFTTSGNSENVLRALAAANDIGAHTIGMLGKDGGKAKSLVTIPLIVGSNETAHIQEGHIAVVHAVCDRLENRLFPE